MPPAHNQTNVLFIFAIVQRLTQTPFHVSPRLFAQYGIRVVKVDVQETGIHESETSASYRLCSLAKTWKRREASVVSVRTRLCATMLRCFTWLDHFKQNKEGEKECRISTVRTWVILEE